MNTVEEINDLKRRVGDLEGAVNVLTGQFANVRPQITALAEANARRFDGVEGLINSSVARLDTLNTQVWSLRDDLPNLVVNALREARGDGSSEN